MRAGTQRPAWSEARGWLTQHSPCGWVQAHRVCSLCGPAWRMELSCCTGCAQEGVAGWDLPCLDTHILQVSCENGAFRTKEEETTCLFTQAVAKRKADYWWVQNVLGFICCRGWAAQLPDWRGSMERLSWALVSCGSDYAIFCTFQNKTKNKVILNTHWIWNAPLFKLNRIILLKIHSKIPFKVGSKEI